MRSRGTETGVDGDGFVKMVSFVKKAIGTLTVQLNPTTQSP